ncbi:MAG: hypothetical protein NZ529_01210 [Cytophagaceae bacterium]|nr:hypothetical protein [Cytophagaceae bacterium]MDW8455383.1 hypothetical protein [Cytophagaceae bacterium]
MRKIILAGIAILILAAGIFAYLLIRPYSTGSRVGTLVKLSKKGLFFKTWEGELNMAMVVGETGSASAPAKPWFFSVNADDDDQIIKDLDALQGKRVRLFYEEYLWKLFWNGDTKYFVYKAELVK